MPIAIVMDWPAGEGGTAVYDALTDAMGVEERPPEGLIFHAAGYVDPDTWRIYDVWESQEDADRFVRERLMPAMGALPDGIEGSPPATTTVYDLYNHWHP